MNKLVQPQRGRPIIIERGGITVTRVGVHLGAEIGGVDLRKPLSDASFEAIRDALVDNELIIFRNQEITSENLIDFGRRFGELTVHPFAPHDEKAPVLIKFRNDENNPPFATDVWHSDETFRSEPPIATILCAKVVPAIGGDTMFASMSTAFDGLSDSMKEFILGSRAFTIGSHLRSFSIAPRKTARTGNTLSCYIHRSCTPWCAFILSRVARYCSSTPSSPSPSRTWTSTKADYCSIRYFTRHSFPNISSGFTGLRTPLPCGTTGRPSTMP